MIKLFRLEGALAVALSGFDHELVGKLPGDGQRFLVRGNAVRVRKKVEARKLLRDGDRRGNIGAHQRSCKGPVRQSKLKVR